MRQLVQHCTDGTPNFFLCHGFSPLVGIVNTSALAADHAVPVPAPSLRVSSALHASDKITTDLPQYTAPIVRRRMHAGRGPSQRDSACQVPRVRCLRGRSARHASYGCCGQPANGMIIWAVGCSGVRFARAESEDRWGDGGWKIAVVWQDLTLHWRAVSRS
jgi:hypothetical protein